MTDPQQAHVAPPTAPAGGIDPLTELNRLITPLRPFEHVTVSNENLKRWRDEIVRLRAFINPAFGR